MNPVGPLSPTSLPLAASRSRGASGAGNNACDTNSDVKRSTSRFRAARRLASAKPQAGPPLALSLRHQSPHQHFAHLLQQHAQARWRIEVEAVVALAQLGGQLAAEVGQLVACF